MGEFTLKYVVLGHTGFVGKNLIQYLASEGHEVIGLSSTECDLRDYKQIAEKLLNIKKIDAIFNCAANVGSVHYVTAKAGCSDIL